MNVDIYNWKGEKAGSLEVSDAVFGVPWNADLIHQVIEALRANERRPVAHAKGRGEVRGGGKKPWRQKGTGRARHGSSRSPIWKGGGVTHGPTKERDFTKALTKKMKLKAFRVALSRKLADQEMIVLDAVSIPEAKTRAAETALRSLRAVQGFEALSRRGVSVIVGAEDQRTARAFRNIPGVRTMEPRNWNARDLLSAKYVLIGKADAAAFAGRVKK